MTAQLFHVSESLPGLVELEEGELNEKEIKTESHTLGRMSFGKPPATKKVKKNPPTLDIYISWGLTKKWHVHPVVTNHSTSVQSDLPWLDAQCTWVPGLSVVLAYGSDVGG